MTELSCEHFRQHAVELALGVLCGRQRAEALRHLHRCTACQQLVCGLTMTVEGLLGLLPEVEPPLGFEQRVTNAVIRPRRARQWRLCAAVVASALAVATGWILGHSSRDGSLVQTTAQTDVRTVVFTPLTSGARQVGQAYLYPGIPSWIYLSLDTDTNAASGAIRCELIHQDGSTAPLGIFFLTKGSAAWATPVTGDPKALAAIKLVDSNRSIIAAAQFAKPVSSANRQSSSVHGLPLSADLPYLGYQLVADHGGLASRIDRITSPITQDQRSIPKQPITNGKTLATDCHAVAPASGQCG